MKLEDLSRALLLRVIRIYLKLAWPKRVEEKIPDLPKRKRGDALLGVFADEPNRDQGEAFRRFVIRLGNQCYPHMKFVLEEHLIPGEFIFCVDTHDELELKPGYPDYEAWQALREFNRELKERIEVAWRSAGIPTYHALKELVVEAEAGGRTQRRSGKILVVDDQREIADAVASILIGAGYDVLLAHDGEQAVTSALRERPDLVIMDYQMPRMDGVEAAIRIRRALPKKCCRILLATAALIDLSTVREADGFLVKPYSREILISFIQALLKQG